MNRLPLATFVLAALLAAAVHAQDAPKPEAKPDAEAGQAPAAAAPAAPGPGQEPDPAIIQEFMDCLAVGLPSDWQRAWLVIKETGRDASGKTRTYEGTSFFATDPKDAKGKRLQNCGGDKILENVGKLNAYLPGNQQRWTNATFYFHREGRYEVKYDFTPPKHAAKPAAKPAAKKKQEAAK